jgi:hypothetical protein
MGDCLIGLENFRIVILNRFVEISPVYLNQYVFVTLDLETSMLKVVSESQGKTYFITNQLFEYTL